MANSDIRYLIGHGERLTRAVNLKSGGGDKADVYSAEYACKRLSPTLLRLANELDELPSGACPNDEAVAIVTMHPQFLAKSYFPNLLLRSIGLEAVGSRPVVIRPESSTLKDGPVEAETIDVYVAGKRRKFREFAKRASSGPDDDLKHINRIEAVRMPRIEERLTTIKRGIEYPAFETVLHARSDDEYVYDGYVDYVEQLGVAVDHDRVRYVDGLCFVPVRASTQGMASLALFSFLRVARPMPVLRQFHPREVDFSRLANRIFSIPADAALDDSLRVAILDGGLPNGHPLGSLVDAHEAQNLGLPDPEAQAHGLQVTSAFLFGPLNERAEGGRPYAKVDHYRVLDEKSHDPTGEYVDVLDRVEQILSTRHYDFVGLSIGPWIATDDGDVNQWTARLDALAARGTTLIVSAVGNDGDADRPSGLARVQSPADGVNVLGVGSCDSLGDNWQRAWYSCVGPGRSPGVVKPDVVAFGGSLQEPFWTIGMGTSAVPTLGTSLASPNALRAAVGTRAYLGPQLNPLAIRALMIHHAHPGARHRHDVGFGRVPLDLQDLLTCDDHSVHIVYQGTLDPRGTIRADVPIPDGGFIGHVDIEYTMVYSCQVDSQDPSSYTRAGLEVYWRPDAAKFSEENDGSQAKTKSMKTYAKTEQQQRKDAGKWETVTSKTIGHNASTLNAPHLDIRYVPREGPADAHQPPRIPYALIVTVRSKNTTDLYNRILARYATHLEALRPIIEIPLRTTV